MGLLDDLKLDAEIVNIGMNNPSTARQCFYKEMREVCEDFITYTNKGFKHHEEPFNLTSVLSLYSGIARKGEALMEKSLINALDSVFEDYDSLLLSEKNTSLRNSKAVYVQLVALGVLAGTFLNLYYEFSGNSTLPDSDSFALIYIYSTAFAVLQSIVISSQYVKKRSVKVAKSKVTRGLKDLVSKCNTMLSAEQNNQPTDSSSNYSDIIRRKNKRFLGS
ncbi:MAG: hypothetical protein JW791_03200 [Nanoarchaeota archaeon]|nr:hypothetical protein [Nanoarchaeota archaeon]